ncbi:MAG: proton-conducting transporter membrane subunit, partial [Actinomycetota bacterium]
MLTSILAAEGGHAVASSPLTVAILLPFVGALAVALVPAARTELHRGVALLFSGAAGALTVWLLAAFEKSEPGFQYVVDETWISDFGISWHLGIDGISLFLVVLTGLLFPLAIVAVTPHHDPKPYYAWLLVLQGGSLGVFMALDLFVFFVFFEIVLVPMYFLIGGWGYGERVYAALKFFIFTMVGSAFMLVGIVALAFLHRDGVAEENQGKVAEVQAAAEAEIGVIAEEAQGLDPEDPASQATFEELSAQVDEINAAAQAEIDA